MGAARKSNIRRDRGTVSRVDRGAKALSVRTASGTEETYTLADHAAEDAGKDIAEGAEKSGKVTVYYTEEFGRNAANFFETTF
jgi:hypothetical protein